MQNFKKEDYENYLGRKISREEFRHNRKELDEELRDIFAANVDKNMTEENEDDFTWEDLLCMLTEDDLKKMKNMTEEEVIEYEKKLCKENGVKYPG